MTWERRLRLKKRMMSVSVVAVSVIATIGISEAHASSSAVVCQGIDEAVYTPAITEVPREVTASIRGTYRCQSPDGVVTGGALTIEGGGTLSCRGGGFTGVLRVAWDNGRQSTMSGGSGLHVHTDDGAMLAGSGRVVDGLFEGGAIRRFVVIDYAGPGCAEVGVSAARASVVMRITPP